MTKKPQQADDQLFQAIMDAIQAGNFTEAEQQCTQILNHIPNHPHALHVLGKIAARNNDLDKAEQCLIQSTKLLTDPNTFISLGMIYLQKHEATQAIDAFYHALKIAPDLEIAVQALKKCGIQESRYKEIREILEDIGKESPLAQSIAINYLQLYQYEIDFYIKSGSLSSAMSTFIELVKQANFHPVSFLNARSIFQQSGIPEDIASSYDGVDSIILSAIAGMGYMFNNQQEAAEIIASKLFTDLEEFLNSNPADNRGWRLLSVATGLYLDKKKGNNTLRDFLGKLPERTLTATYMHLI